MGADMIRLICLVLLASVCAAAPARAQFGGSFGTLGSGPSSFAPLVKAVAPEIVGITVTEDAPKTKPGNGVIPPLAEAAGSGFIITPDGMIVTNNHVISGAATIFVTLNDGRRYVAKLIGTDELTDIAIIKVNLTTTMMAARWGNSARCQVGDWILAAGNPFALGNSFTAGIISAEGRDIGDGPFDHFLQLDAPINPGNSGGPAFNLDGEVIGINTAIVSPSGGSVGIGFAIPSNYARKIVATLIAHGSVARGWLGVSVQDATGINNAPIGGAAITGVEPGGPAENAGLTISDVVLAVNGSPVSGSADLIRAIASVTPGVKVVLTVTRNGHMRDVPVVVDQRPAQLGG
jgi:serine protease Do